MLMMTPLFCARMIGITCLAARMQLFRLIATQRSNASSVMSSSSASPPDRLTPTLLCRISMRPQRPCASATIALMSAFLVTSALKATAVPPLAAIMSTVSWAEFEMVIDAQHLGAFAREGERGGAAVADAFAGALAGADDDGDTIFQAHLIPLPGSGTAAVPLCNRAHCPSSSSPARGRRRNRRRW